MLISVKISIKSVIGSLSWKSLGVGRYSVKLGVVPGKKSYSNRMHCSGKKILRAYSFLPLTYDWATPYFRYRVNNDRRYRLNYRSQVLATTRHIICLSGSLKSRIQRNGRIWKESGPKVCQYIIELNHLCYVSIFIVWRTKHVENMLAFNFRNRVSEIFIETHDIKFYVIDRLFYSFFSTLLIPLDSSTMIFKLLK